jgi:hypothetical protein
MGWDAEAAQEAWDEMSLDEKRAVDREVEALELEELLDEYEAGGTSAQVPPPAETP